MRSTIIERAGRRLKRPWRNRMRTNHVKKFFYYDKTTIIKNNERVLIFSIIGSIDNVYTELLLYHFLLRQGYDVDFVVCSGELPACEILTQERLKRYGKEAFCRRCFGQTRRVLNAAGVDFEILSEACSEKYIQDLENLDFEELLAFELDGIKLGEIAKHTLYRYYKSTLLDDIDAEAVLRKFVLAGITSYLNAKIRIESNNYSFVMFSHGIYVSWGPVAKLCEAVGQRYICYDRAKTASTYNFNLNQSAVKWDFPTAWERWEGKDLSPDQERKVDMYIRSREHHDRDVYTYNFTPRASDTAKLKSELGIPHDATVITLFTNLTWDAASAARHVVFPSQTEWIERTVAHFRDRPDVHVLLRVHPAELVLGTNEPIVSNIGALLSDPPANFVVLPPNAPVNSFSVIDISDIGVAHTSTVGLEMALSSKPILLISNTHYRGKGFTYDVAGADEYFEVLDRLISTPSFSEARVKLARKYFYMMMFEYQKIMPLILEDGVFGRYNCDNINELNLDDDISRLAKVFGDETLRDFIF